MREWFLGRFQTASSRALLGEKASHTRSEASLVLCYALIEGLGGTVWRSQAVVFRMLHGLPAAPVGSATQTATA